MKSNRVVSSFSRIKLSPEEKADLLAAILKKADHERRMDKRKVTMNRINIWKYAVSVAAIVIIVAGATLVYSKIVGKQGVPSSPNAVSSESSPLRIEDPVASQQEGEQPAADSDYIVRYVGLKLGASVADQLTVPDSLDVAVSNPVVFSNKAIDQIVTNLKNAGWNGIYHDRFENHPELVYLKQPETYEWNNSEKESNFEASEEHRNLGREFILESGLIELIRLETGIELSSEPTDDTFATIFRGYYDGFCTDTYVRLSFSPDGTMTEMKLYAVKFDTVVTTSSVVSVEHAVKNTFGFSESGYGQVNDDEITVSDIEIVYYEGIPFYKFICEQVPGVYGQLSTLALAVDYDVIAANKDILAAYENLMENGIW